MTPTMFEFQVKLFREQVMALAAKGDVPTDVVAAALADVLGTAAALLDRRDGAATLADRMHDFEQRVGRAYRNMRDRMEVSR